MKHLFLTGLAALIVAGPASAQSSGAMQHEDKMANGAKPTKMTAAQAKDAKRCMALSADAKAKDAGCRKLAQAHPDPMMSSGDAMAPH